MLNSLSNQSMLNMSSASSTSLAELSKSKLNANDSSLLANSHANSTLLYPKYKIKRDDYYGLLRQSLKCFSLNISTMSIDHSIDDSFDMSSCSQLSLHNDSALTHVSRTSRVHQDPWSVDTESICITGIRAEANMQVFAHKLVLRNNTGSKVQMVFTYRQSCLEIQPISENCLTLRSYEKCELRVMPRREVLNKLPWHGLLTISSNSCKKDIKVSN